MADTRTPPDTREETAWAEAEAWGCDMNQLAHQLALTVRERLRQHDRALAAVLALRAATEAHRARP